MKKHITLLLVATLSFTMTVTFGGGRAYCQNASAIQLKISPYKHTFKVGEPITLVCEIRNVSNFKLSLPPLQIVDVHFSIYRYDILVLPFEFPSMQCIPKMNYTLLNCALVRLIYSREYLRKTHIICLQMRRLQI